MGRSLSPLIHSPRPLLARRPDSSRRTLPLPSKSSLPSAYLFIQHPKRLALLMPPTGAIFTIVLIGIYQFRLVAAEQAFLASHPRPRLPPPIRQRSPRSSPHSPRASPPHPSVPTGLRPSSAKSISLGSSFISFLAFSAGATTPCSSSRASSSRSGFLSSPGPSSHKPKQQ